MSHTRARELQEEKLTPAPQRRGRQRKPLTDARTADCQSETCRPQLYPLPGKDPHTGQLSVAPDEPTALRWLRTTSWHPLETPQTEQLRQLYQGASAADHVLLSSPLEYLKHKAQFPQCYSSDFTASQEQALFELHSKSLTPLCQQCHYPVAEHWQTLCGRCWYQTQT